MQPSPALATTGGLALGLLLAATAAIAVRLAHPARRLRRAAVATAVLAALANAAHTYTYIAATHPVSVTLLPLAIAIVHESGHGTLTIDYTQLLLLYAAAELLLEKRRKTLITPSQEPPPPTRPRPEPGEPA